TLTLWNTSTGPSALWGKIVGFHGRTFQGHKIHGGTFAYAVRMVAFSPDGLSMLSGSVDSTLRLWDAATGRLLRTFEGHSSIVTSVGCSPDGRSALSGTADQTGKLWDVASGTLLRTFERHLDQVTGVVFSRDGHHAVSVSRDSTVRLWSLATGREVVRLF